MVLEDIFIYCMKLCENHEKYQHFPLHSLFHFVVVILRYFFLIVVKYAEHKFTALIIFSSSMVLSTFKLLHSHPHHPWPQLFHLAYLRLWPHQTNSPGPSPRPLVTTTLLSVSMKLSLLECDIPKTHYWVKNPDKRKNVSPTQQVSLEFLV